MIIKHQHFDLASKVVFERATIQPPFKMQEMLSNEACFTFALRGRRDVYTPEQKVSIHDECGVLMRCDSYLSKCPNKDCETPFEAIVVHFYPEVLKFIYQDQPPFFLEQKSTQEVVSVQPIKVDTMMLQYVESLEFYFDHPQMVNEELLSLKLRELIVMLVNADPSRQMEDFLADLFATNEHSFKHVIENHIFHDLSLDELAFLTNTSLSTFKRKFKELFNDSPAHYIKRRRLEKAKDLLLRTNLSITDICYEVSFTEVSHFSRSFRQLFGRTPSVFRKKALVGNLN